MHFLPELQGYLSIYGYFAIFVIVGLESAGVPMPGETILVASALLAGQGKMSIYGVVGAAALGAILGDNCGYWVGRELGFPIAYRYGRFVHLDERRLKLGQYLFLKHGGKIVFFGRFIAILRAFESYARSFGFAALAAAVVAFFIGGRFVRYHAQALEEEAERALPGPLVPPKTPRAQ